MFYLCKDNKLNYNEIKEENNQKELRQAATKTRLAEVLEGC
jgi:hypothetical protein